MSRPFSFSMSSGTLSFLEKYMTHDFPSLIFLFQRSPQIHCSEATLQFAENMIFMFLRHLNTDIVHE
jgi:hypothetical protein